MIKRNEQIWKLQRPMATLGFAQQPVILAYTKDKEQITQIPVEHRDQLDAIFGDALKIYVKAHMEGGLLKVRKQVKDQAW